MSLLLTVSSTHPTGAAASALLLARALARGGHAVQLACREGPLAETARRGDLAAVHAWHFHKNAHPVRVRQDMRRLGRVVDGGVELVHCHRSTDHFIARLTLGGAPRSVPLIRTYHEPLGASAGIGTRLLFRYATDRLVLISRAAAERLRAEMAVLAARIDAVGGAIDTARFTPGDGRSGRAAAKIPPGRLVVGTVSKLAPERQLERVIRAFARMRHQDRHDAHLLLIGSGSPAPYDRLAAELDVGGRVTVRAGNREFIDLIRAIDVGVQLVPGSDGSGRAALELMAAGKPVITTPTGAFAEIVDPTCGRVVASDAELAAAMAELLASAPLRRALGAEARRRVERDHQPDAWAARYERIYRHALAAAAAART